MKVILYNFFEESAPENFWQFLVDTNQNKILESKYASLIHEVSDNVYFRDVRRLTSSLLSLNVSMLLLPGQSTGFGLWTIPKSADQSRFVHAMLLRGLESDRLGYSGVYLTAA